MSATPQTDLATVEAAIKTLQAQQAAVGQSLSNAGRDKTLKTALESVTTGQKRLSAAESMTASILAGVQAALVAINTSIYPSGITPPSVPSGYQLAAFDDFTSTSLTAMWAAPYNGLSEAEQDGYFIAAHTVTRDDSLLRLDAYPDPASIINCWEYNEATAASVAQWGGAGVQTVTRWPVGTRFIFAARWDTYPAITPIMLTMGDVWPPEQDIIEANVTTRHQPVTTFQESFHYGQNNQVQIPVVAAADYSQWHLWEVDWTTHGTTVTCDGKVVADCPFTATMTSSPTAGLSAPQFLAFQIQTGDPNNPAADPSVTAKAPVSFCIDWLQVLTPETTAA